MNALAQTSTIQQAMQPENLLVVDGNPLEDIPVLRVYRNNLKLIMQDGKILKNTLVPAGDPGYRPVISTIVTN